MKLPDKIGPIVDRCAAMLRDRRAAGLLLAVMLAAVWLRAPEAVAPPLPENLGQGEAILHGLENGRISLAMPLSAVGEALLENHVPDAVERGFPMAAALLSYLLVFSLGRLLHSNACGLLAALIAVSLGLAGPFDEREQAALVTLMLVLANLAAWRARSPDPRRSLLLGLAIGLCLLVKSPLFLFPPLLSLYEWFRHRDKTRAQRLKLVAPTLILPVLILLPWIHMNRSVHGGFIPLEKGRGEQNLVQGAMGLTEAVTGGDIRKMAGIPKGDSASAWIAGEILRHPLRYTGAFLARLWFAIALHPLLLLLAGFGAWMFRGREESRQIYLLAAYFIGVHCLIAVFGRYFVPVWPIIAALAAAPLARWIEPSPEEGEARLSLGLCLAALVPMTAAACFVLYLVGSYPSRLDASSAGLDRALKAYPEDPWLWSLRGERNMRRGSVSAAVKDFTKALSLDDRTAHSLDLAWAMTARHEPGEDLVDKLTLSEPAYSRRGHMIKLLGHLRAGRADPAREELSSVKRIWRDEVCAVPVSDPDRKRHLEDLLCGEELSLESDLLDILAPIPAHEYAIALKLLPELARGAVSRSMVDAQTAAQRGERDQVLRALARAEAAESAAEGFEPEPEHTRRKGRLFLEAGMPRRALEAYGLLVRDREAGVDPLLGHARAASGLGKKSPALESLDRALSRKPSPRQLLRIAHVYQEMKECGRALKILQPLTQEPEVAPEAYRAKGICEHLEGSADVAIADLERAVELDPGSLAAYLSLSSVYSSSGRQDKAREACRRALDAASDDSPPDLRRALERMREDLSKP
ncbi:tetratricopeptide repeat protein [Elusimicrobiota bacterium]